MGHIFAGRTVAPSRAKHELAVFITQADGRTVELGLRPIGHALDGDVGSNQPIADTFVERAELVVAEHVVERQHGFRVPNFAERFELGSADALRRGVGRHEIGTLALNLLETPHQAVVLRVRYRRLVEHVIRKIVRFDRLAQLGQLGSQLRETGSRALPCPMPQRRSN